MDIESLLRRMEDERVLAVGGSWMLKGSREEKIEKMKTIMENI